MNCSTIQVLELTILNLNCVIRIFLVLSNMIGYKKAYSNLHCYFAMDTFDVILGMILLNLL